MTALSLGLVKGNDWGWSSAATIGSLAGAVVALGAFAVHCARHRNPLIDARLFSVRAFSGSSVVALIFSIAFGSMLFSRVLFAQDVWHWSALTTGLSIAPGPAHGPGVLVRGRRTTDPAVRPGPVIAAGATIFAAGAAWWAAAVTIRPDYVSGSSAA